MMVGMLVCQPCTSGLRWEILVIRIALHGFPWWWGSMASNISAGQLLYFSCNKVNGTAMMTTLL